MSKTLLEIAQEKGKNLLIENSSFSLNKGLEILEFDKTRMIESKNNKYEALAVVKNVPVSGFNKNDNGRTYSRPLWESVYKSKVWEGNVALADHPQNEGSVTQVWGVWHEMKVNQNDVTADLYLVEEKPIKILKAGGKLGTSSVAFGNVDEKGNVLEEGFELERLSDIVLRPSQGTYATIDNIQESTTNQPKTEDIDIKIEENTNISEKDNTNKCTEKNVNNKNDYKENNEVLNMDKIQEAQFKNTINEQVSKAKKNEDLFEAVSDLKAIDTADNAELSGKVESTLQEIQEKIANKEKDLNKKLEEKTSEANKLSEDYDNAVKVADELKEKLNKVSAFIEQVVEAEEDFDSEVFVENYKTLKEDHEKVMEMFESDSFKKYEIDKLNDFVDLVEDTVKRDTDLSDVEAELETAKLHIVECETQLEKLGYKFDENAEDKIEEKKAKVKEEDDEEEKKDDEKKDDKEIEEKKVKEEDDEEEKKDDKEMEEKKVKEEEGEDEKKDDEKEDEKEMDEKKKEKKSKKESGPIKYKFNDNSTSYTPLYEDVVEEDDSEKLEEAENNRISEEIKIFFEKQIKKYPGLKEFEKEILGTSSLLEAIDTVEDLRENKDEMVSFKTNKVNQRPSYMRNSDK